MPHPQGRGIFLFKEKDMKSYALVIVCIVCILLGFTIGKTSGSITPEEKPLNLEQGICVDAIKRMNHMSRQNYTYYNQKQIAIERMMKN
jgi:hypothetical protein